MGIFGGLKLLLVVGLLAGAGGGLFYVKNLKANYNKILICFSPIIPHFTNECLSEIGYQENINWPKVNKNLLETNEINYVIQINGKKRVILKKQKDISEKELLENVKKKEFDTNVKSDVLNEDIFPISVGIVPVKEL